MQASIVVDIFEKEIYKLLKNEAPKSMVIQYKETKVGGGKEYDPTADIAVFFKNGNIISFGFERKTILDCYNSIISKRIYKQLDKLRALYGKRAVLLIEGSYFPKQLMWKRREIEQAVNTFFSEQTFLGPVVLTRSRNHTAYFILKFIKDVQKGRYKELMQ